MISEGTQSFFSNSNPELLAEFIDYMRQVLGAEPRIWVQKINDFHEKREWLKRVNNIQEIPKGNPVGLFYPRICCDILHLILGRFACGKEKTITPQIKNAPDDFKKWFIRAFFDDEGSISSNEHMARFHQDNKVMLNDLRHMLEQFGIHTNEVKGYFKRDKVRYYFSMTGFNAYCRYYYLIGCTSTKKRQGFQSLVEKVIKSKKFKNKFNSTPMSNALTFAESSY